MGYGLLILGYLTVLGMLPTSGFIYVDFISFVPVFGCAFMLAGLWKLGTTDVFYKAAAAAVFLLLLVQTAFIPFEMIEPLSRHNETARIASLTARLAILPLFHILLLLALKRTALGMNDMERANRAERNLYLTLAYFAVAFIVFITINLEFSWWFTWIAQILRWSPVVAWLLSLASFTLNAVLIYGTYIQVSINKAAEEEQSEE